MACLYDHDLKAWGSFKITLYRPLVSKDSFPKCKSTLRPLS